MSSPALQSDLPKTGLAWFTLAAATCALLLLCVWALFNQDQLFTGNTASSPDSQLTTISAVDENATADKLAAEKAEADKLAAEQAEAQRLAAEQAEALKLAAEQAEADKLAAEQAEADKLAAEQAEADKLAAEQAEADKLAAEQAEAERLAAEQAEADKLAAEQAEAERLAAEQAEADKLAAEQAEADRLAAEQQAEAQRLAAEQAAAEQLAAEQLAVEKAEAERLAAETAQAEQLVRDQTRSIPSIDQLDDSTLESGTGESPFERQRLVDLAGLPSLSTQILFETRDLEPLQNSKEPLDRLFEMLFLYSETTVTVQVSSNEYELSGNNELISRERALTIVNYLIDRGLDEERFRIRALGQQRLPFGTHRVIVVATVIDE